MRATTKMRSRARELRKAQTPWEAILWSRIRRKQINGIRFVRQHVIGHYIVDFCAPSAGLIVELDGSQHYRSSVLEKDRQRDAALRRSGWRVLRFTNQDVDTRIDDVLEEICRQVVDI